MQIDVQLRSLPGTEAAVGWVGGHSIIADRPEGKAGGLGLGFNGGQLLAFAIGGCFCNDLRYVAEEIGAEIAEISIDVQLELSGKPLIAKSGRMTVDCSMADNSDPAKVIERAKASCFVSNTLARGVSVDISIPD